MSRITKRVFIVAASLVCGSAAAQTFKCTDKAGKVTYSSTKCNELGLQDAGEVPDRINVNPAYRPPRASEPARPPAPAAPAAPAAAPQAAAPGTPAAPEAPTPERRCFTVRTPTGVVTRCNDKPEE
jgi:hypothetical protein